VLYDDDDDEIGLMKWLVLSLLTPFVLIDVLHAVWNPETTFGSNDDV